MKILLIKKFLNTKNIPNVITFARILLIFPIIILLEINNLELVWLILIIGGITDFLDGFLAKRLNNKSTLGAIIDPLADKIFILIPFAWLSIYQVIPFWSFAIIIFRELVISSFRVMKKNGLPAIKIAKYKSLSQFISLIFFFNPFKNVFYINLGLTFYWIGFVLCIYSLIKYLRVK